MAFSVFNQTEENSREDMKTKYRYPDKDECF
jgi:hypothetical protein